MFNQAAGNRFGQWGYASSPQFSEPAGRGQNYYAQFSHSEYLPIYSDARHPVSGDIPDLATRIPTTPCDPSTEAKRFFDGKLQVTSYGKAVLGNTKGRDWDSSHMIQLEKKYHLEALETKKWRFFKVEQALYLNKWTAAVGNLRVYLVGPNALGAWAYLSSLG